MLDTWEAERIDRILEGGRTKPFVAECSLVELEPVSGSGATDTQSFIVKAMGNPHVEPFSLFNEVVGNMLAKRLGLNTPDPALIRITPEFAKSAAMILTRYGFAISPGIASGAAYLGSGLIPPTFGVLPTDSLEQIALIYAFDLVMQNPDRRSEKPNCTFQRGNLIAFDFELCFSFVFAIGRPDPCDFIRHGICEKHLFRGFLSKRSVDWKPFLHSLEGLSDSEIDAMINAVPLEWRGFSGQVAEHLRFMREQPSRIELELQRSLQ